MYNLPVSEIKNVPLVLHALLTIFSIFSPFSSFSSNFGSKDVLVFPVPNCPYIFKPNVTGPFSVTTQVCEYPAAT